jgi:carboxypeptidase PM20D1
MARYIADTLRAGGVPAADIVTIPHEDTVGLLVRLAGLRRVASPILFSAHMDVVDARPEDWKRDPFTLIEENGMFYGRGTSDNKAGVASMMSTILRFTDRAVHAPPDAGLRVHRRRGDRRWGQRVSWRSTSWVRNAEFAINTDAGGGMLDEKGRALYYLVQGAEKDLRRLRWSPPIPAGTARGRATTTPSTTSRARSRDSNSIGSP